MAKSKAKQVDYCAFPCCRQESDVIWLGVGLCSHHNEWKNNTTLKKAYNKLSIKAEIILENESEEIIKGIEKKAKKKGLSKFITEEN